MAFWGRNARWIRAEEPGVISAGTTVASTVTKPRASRRMRSYRISSIMETVSRALAIFSVTKGDVKQGIIAAANFGRDADCLGATVG